MNKNKEQLKKKRFNGIKAISIVLGIILVVISSCSSEQESDIDTIDLPVDMEMDTLFNAPLIQTPAPLIHLADNLDEQDMLGWCIDTRGNGFNENIHLHSCKASGGDVQFTYNAETRQICSAEFIGFCIEMSEGPFEGTSLILVESNTDTPNQRFVYNEANGEFTAEEDANLCLAAGDTSAAAGIYMSRSLTLEISSETEENLKKWVVVTE